MELDVEINPSAVEEEYLSGLNRSFGQWGDRDAYRWDFEREVGARPADLMVLRDHGQILAGSAVSYRTVSLGDDRILIGIMTGSWTLPEARGRGAFSQVIVESRRLVASRGGAVLIAFVTHENASRRRLMAAGCLEIPTWYVASNHETMAPAEAAVVELSTAPVAQLFRDFKRWQGRGAGASVFYPSLEVWASQYIDRPLPVERLTAAGRHCLIERAPVSDRVLWIDGQDRTSRQWPLSWREPSQRDGSCSFSRWRPGLSRLGSIWAWSPSRGASRFSTLSINMRARPAWRACRPTGGSRVAIAPDLPGDVRRSALRALTPRSSRSASETQVERASLLGQPCGRKLLRARARHRAKAPSQLVILRQSSDGLEEIPDGHPWRPGCRRRRWSLSRPSRRRRSRRSAGRPRPPRGPCSEGPRYPTPARRYRMRRRPSERPTRRSGARPYRRGCADVFRVRAIREADHLRPGKI